MQNRSGLLKSLGPGLVWAATAIGVSHLVQSTRAGAEYGFALVGVVIAANLLKYPFFEFGPRYAAATGESLLEGYARQGRWTVVVYLLLTVGTMFAVTGAVTFVAGSLATQLFGPALSPFGYSAVLLGLCALLLIPGRYPLLDALVKAIIVILTVSTLWAVLAAALAQRPDGAVPGPAAPALLSGAGFAFVIALAGWMPSAIDISVWSSLWTLERGRQTGYRPRLREVLFDFNLGYWGTAVLALLFLALGAFLIHGSGRQLAAGGAAFAAQLVTAYTDALGAWSRPVIALAAFTTMFSTTLTVTDGFPRALRRATGILLPRWRERSGEGLYWGWMLVVVAGALLLISAFRNRLTLMVDVATTLSFLTAPVLSWFNLRAVTDPHMPPESRPGRGLLALAWAGLVFGTLFAGIYLVWRLLS
jgi:Mn2+/Fe2+ NRAMP family transporter